MPCWSQSRSATSVVATGSYGGNREAFSNELFAVTPPGWHVGMRRLTTVVLVLTTLVVASCELVEPDRPQIPPGMRALVIPVDNRNGQPAVLVVAEDTHPIGRAIGSATPPAVPPGTKLDVTFVVPNVPGWAIFVNPGPERGPLLIESELRNCIGHIPASIHVGPGGEPSWSHGRDPGCLTP